MSSSGSFSYGAMHEDFAFPHDGKIKFVGMHLLHLIRLTLERN